MGPSCFVFKVQRSHSPTTIHFWLCGCGYWLPIPHPLKHLRLFQLDQSPLGRNLRGIMIIVCKFGSSYQLIIRLLRVCDGNQYVGKVDGCIHFLASNIDTEISGSPLTVFFIFYCKCILDILWTRIQYNKMLACSQIGENEQSLE